MATIDPIQFGRMLEAMEKMGENLNRLEHKVDTLQLEVQSLMNLKHSGKGILLGLTFAGGGAGALLTKLMEHVK